MNPLMPVKDVPTSSGILAISYPHCSPDETSGLPAPLILINTPIDVLSAVISKPDLIFVTDNFVGDTESRDANYDQIEVVVIDVVGAAAAYSPRYGRDHPNLIDRWECNASICNPPLRGIHKAYDRSPAIGWKRVIVYVFSFIKSKRGYFFVPKNDTCRTSDFSNIPFTVTGYGITD